MFRYILARLNSEMGQDLVEYSLLAGLIAVALVGVSILALTAGVEGMGDGIAECIDWDTVDCLS